MNCLDTCYEPVKQLKEYLKTKHEVLISNPQRDHFIRNLGTEGNCWHFSYPANPSKEQVMRTMYSETPKLASEITSFFIEIIQISQ